MNLSLILHIMEIAISKSLERLMRKRPSCPIPPIYPILPILPILLRVLFLIPAHTGGGAAAWEGAFRGGDGGAALDGERFA